MFKVGPLYYENYVCPTKVAINQGGTSCFEKNTLIATYDGCVPISNVRVGTLVKCFDHTTLQTTFKKVLNVFEFENFDRTVKIKLKNGKTIICTENHLFFINGKYQPIKSILNGNLETNTKS